VGHDEFCKLLESLQDNCLPPSAPGGSLFGGRNCPSRQIRRSNCLFSTVLLGGSFAFVPVQRSEGSAQIGGQIGPATTRDHIPGSRRAFLWYKTNLVAELASFRVHQSAKSACVSYFCLCFYSACRPFHSPRLSTRRPAITPSTITDTTLPRLLPRMASVMSVEPSTVTGYTGWPGPLMLTSMCFSQYRNISGAANSVGERSTI
jgi:hypothetical protein